MPYFVVVHWREKLRTMPVEGSYRTYQEALPEAYDTLAAAEAAARRRAEDEQEWPWTSVYVVEAVNHRRAARINDPNRHERGRAEHAIYDAAIRDPQGRVPEPTERLSAFQPPRVRLSLPAPSSLSPAAFTDPLVGQAFAALLDAGFALVAAGHSAYFEALPSYAPTEAAQARLRAEVQAQGGPSTLSGEQELQDRLFQSQEDVFGVAQRFDLFEGDGEFDIGDLGVYEVRTDTGIDEIFARVREQQQRRRRRVGELGTRNAHTAELRRHCYFRTRRVLLVPRLWAPDEAQWQSVTVALARVAGLPQQFDEAA